MALAGPAGTNINAEETENFEDVSFICRMWSGSTAHKDVD